MLLPVLVEILQCFSAYLPRFFRGFMPYFAPTLALRFSHIPICFGKSGNSSTVGID